MTRRWLLVVFLEALLGPVSAVAQKTKENGSHSEKANAPPGPEPDLERARQLIVKATNAFRRQEGRGDLHVNDTLMRAAQSFADFMAVTDKFSHMADGKEPWDRVKLIGYQYGIVAENIAWEQRSSGFTTRELAKALVEGWKRSPEHRKNMLDSDVVEIGIGIARSKKTGRYYAVQEFGRPRSLDVNFTINNQTDKAIHYQVDGKDFSLRPNYTATLRRARPPRLTIGASGDKGRVYRPANNDHYTVRKGREGGLTIEED